MVVKRVSSPARFLELAGPLLLGDEARHNLMLGIAGNVRDHPGLYAAFRAWVGVDDERIVGAALRTPPYNLALARPESDAAVMALVTALRRDSIALPGVTAALPEADTFADMWLAASDSTRRARMRQRIYRLTSVNDVPGVQGSFRHATAADLDLLLAWVQAFADESFEWVQDRDATRRTVEARLLRGLGGFALWEDGQPVSLVGWGGRTPNGVRIGPVFTPPAHRRRGYATALTAAVSAEQLALGRRFCFLYTDLANPTSNKIYVDVGYEPICDSVDYAFEQMPARS